MSKFKRSLATISAILICFISPVKALAIDFNFYNLNNIVFYDSKADCDGPNSSTLLSGNDNAEKVWNALINEGFNDVQAAGIMGNIQHESGFNPDLTEVNGYGGYGLVQWTDHGSSTRRSQLERAAREKGVEPSNLEFQIEYFLNEFKTSYKRTYDKIKQAKTIKESVFYFETEFEISNDWGAAGISQSDRSLETFDRAPNMVKRYEYAKEFYKKFTNQEHALKSNYDQIAQSTQKIDQPLNQLQLNAKKANSSDGREPGVCSLTNFDRNAIRSFSLTAKDPSWVDGKFINKIIAQTEANQGGKSKMSGMGDFIKKTADKYGINTGIFLGQAYKETKLGVFPCGGQYNFGCIAFADWFGFGKAHAAGREWIDPPTAEEGVEAYFKLVKKVYIEDRGHKTYGEYIDVYSPAYDQQASTGGQESFIKDMYCMINGVIGQDVTKTYGNKGTNGNNLTPCGPTNGRWATSADATRITPDGFTIFNQWDPRWGSTWMPTCGMTMAGCACGPTSFAMIATALGVPLSPVESMEKATSLGLIAGYGSSNELPKIMAQNYGLKSQLLDNNNIASINSHLDKGHLIWLGGTSPMPPFPGGHIVVVRKKLPNGKWLIADPNAKPENDMIEFEPTALRTNTATAVWR